jgi:hypothetical protein
MDTLPNWYGFLDQANTFQHTQHNTDITNGKSEIQIHYPQFSSILGH